MGDSCEAIGLELSSVLSNNVFLSVLDIKSLGRFRDTTTLEVENRCISICRYHLV